jgi:hypothetical protein
LDNPSISFGPLWNPFHAFVPGMEALNDNDELSFITLGAATLNVVRYLEGSEKEQERGERDAGRSDKDEEKAKQQREAVEHGLNHIAAFEKRARGEVVRVRRKRF